jgi:cobalamin biosynthesis protein CobT
LQDKARLSSEIKKLSSQIDLTKAPAKDSKSKEGKKEGDKKEGEKSSESKEDGEVQNEGETKNEEAKESEGGKKEEESIDKAEIKPTVSKKVVPVVKKKVSVPASKKVENKLVAVKKIAPVVIPIKKPGIKKEISEVSSEVKNEK